MESVASAVRDKVLWGFSVIARVWMPSDLPISTASIVRATSPDAEIPISRLSAPEFEMSGNTYLDIDMDGADRAETPAHCMNASSRLMDA
jgi:hypothetical protein